MEIVTREQIEAEVLMKLAPGGWWTANQLRKQYASDQADTFWGAMNHLYKSKRIERGFDMYGVTIYRKAQPND